LTFIALAGTPAHHIEYVRPRRLLTGRYAGPLTSTLAFVLLPLAVLRVTIFRKPPIERDARGDHQ
jgi:hypothetical protein